MSTRRMLGDVEPVRIDDEGFFITSVMEDFPVQTVIRELVQNAIEASGSGQRIEWFIFEWEGIPKLGLYNEGAGMTAQQLEARMAIASSGRHLGYDANFGIGAKMSAGAASPFGLLYRSCCHGCVSEIWLQVRERPDGNKVLVKVKRVDPLAQAAVTVRNVTEDALKRGRSIDNDWTEAILLGRGHDDNTLNGDFLGKASTSWLATLIAQRYYAFPAGTTIHNVSVIAEHQRKQSYRLGRSLSELLAEPAYTARSEDVSCIHPKFGKIVLTYGRLAGHVSERRGGGAWYAVGLDRGTHVCLVWKNEIYDFDPRWAFRAGAYGFAGSSEDYYVHILLNEDAPVRNGKHRMAIITKDGARETVSTMDFADYVKEHRPAWIIADIQDRLQQQGSEDLEKRIRKLIEELKDENAKVPQPVLNSGDGPESGVREFDKGDTLVKPGPPNPQPVDPVEHGRVLLPSTGPRSTRSRIDALKVYFKKEEDNPGWYEMMEGKAGIFDWGDNTLWLSQTFSTYGHLTTWIDGEWGFDEEQHKFAISTLDNEYRFRAASLAIGALTFRGQRGWNEKDLRESLGPVVISCHMRDPAKELQRSISMTVGRKFKGSSSAAKVQRGALANG